MIKALTNNQAINQGLIFLAKNQQRDGSFLSLASAKPKNWQQGQKCPTVFSSAFILQALNSLTENVKIRTIKKRLANFLLSQKSPHWTFNYWSRQAKEFKTMAYPDDLDDTSCALAALFQYNLKIIDGAVLAKFVTVLTALEVKQGGPYRTWLVKPDTDKIWRDVDLAVNSNIAYFLSLNEIKLNNLTTLIEKAIQAEKFTSPYYPSFYPIIYFISRFYQGKKSQPIIDFLFNHQTKTGHWPNPLDTSLCVLSLLNLGVSPKKLTKSLNYLLKTQVKNHWLWHPFYRGIKGYFAGSPALTTAFCLAALHQYLKLSQNARRLPKSKTTFLSASSVKKASKDEQKIYQLIIASAKKRCHQLSAELKSQAQKALVKILKQDKDKQILLLPYFFKDSLGQNAKNISEEKIVQLGLANLYGWIAYTIYDDFLDDEGQEPFLPVANLILRELTTIFNGFLPAASIFHHLFRQIMDMIDAANTWEVLHCRFKNPQMSKQILRDRSFNIPDFGDFTLLSHKSLGHALGPLALLFLLGYSEQSPEIRNLLSFFKHYLTARQLNDDAHDWERDFKKGQINSVGATLLKKWQKSKLSSKKSSVTLAKIMPELQKIFWYELIPQICQIILEQTALAKKALQKIPLVVKPSVMLNLLKPTELASQKALKERQETLKFLKAYRA